MRDTTITRTLGQATQYLADLADALRLVPAEALAEAIDLLIATRASGQRVYVIGNGGSAATASHFVCDLVKSASVVGHRPLRVFALADSVPLLTAWANDDAYARSFAHQVSAFVEPGDVLIAISASGNSANIVAAVQAAAAAGARTIALLGFDGGQVRALVDLPIHIPCHDYGLVEDVHAAIGHALTVALRSSPDDLAI